MSEALQGVEKSFWDKLPKPFFAQAPMEDVTDAAFRRLIAKYGKPDVMFSEFTSADGLILADADGQKKLRKKLLFSPAEHPIVAQLFTSDLGRMEAAARIVAEMGFDGVDINMGCPDRAVEKSGCGAALIKTPRLARELIRAAKRGWATKYGQGMSIFPISVKTRLGYNADELETWLPELLAETPTAVTVHARTRKEMSDVPARWERVKRAVEIRNELKSSTLILGNGDVENLKDARARVAETGCDGVMLGRAIYGNPWLFSYSRELEDSFVPTPHERINALMEHLKLFDELMSDTTGYATMKKHFKAYISGWDGAKELRVKLMETEGIEDARVLLDSVIGNYG